MRRCPFAFFAFAAFVACSSSGVHLTPQPQAGPSSPASTAHPSPTPTASGHPTPSPTPTPVSTASMSAAQLNAALNNVGAYYETLPHVSVSADLQSVAGEMTASGTFSSAVVTQGGIDARFPNGMEAMIFADRPDDLSGAFDVVEARARPLATIAPAPLSAPNRHEIAFLVDDSGDRAFNPTRTAAFAAAFPAVGFTAANGYGVDALSISLGNIQALGSGHPLDFLDINTHGSVGYNPAGVYWMMSTTQITDAALATYSADIKAGRVVPSLGDFGNLGPTFGFNAAFLAEHLTFNAGAIIDDMACNGQNPEVTSGLQQLSSQGVGRLIGWDRPVEAMDSDQTDAFLLDRLLGEQSPSTTGLNAYAVQHAPPQRPFPLDQVEVAMTNELRAGPLDDPLVGPPYTTYAVSDPSRNKLPRYYTHLIITDYGGESVANPPIEYALPSISHVVADEVNGQLDILGTFPATPGTVTITNASGSATPAPASWSTNEVIVPLPSNGAGSYGMVSVTNAGITSNAVPLTEWTGRITYSANGSLSNWAGDTGSGSFSLQGVFNAILRADVHPTVVTIDASPVPQMFAFTGLAPGSSGALTAGSGNFTSDNSQGNSCKNCSITLGLVNPQPTMVPQPLSSGSANAFFVLPETGPTPPAGVSVPSPPANCNAGVPGPAPSNTNPLMFCGFLYYNVNNPITCTGNANYCSIANGPLMDELPLNPGVDYLAPSFTLTMDPIFYRLTFASSQQALDLDPFGEPSTGTASLGGTFQAPQSAPGSTTPAFRLRRF